MASIRSLLNPDTSCPSLNPASSQRELSLQSPHSERKKVPKDQPSFRRGKVQGEVRYRVHDERDEELKTIHLKHKLYPIGNIADFPDRIPYTSKKRSFKERTGREGFEVFHYTFEMPDNPKTWVISWDYNVGLVLTRSLFKCNGHPKTAPAKVLKMNPGLGDISHSITGGALVGQGYWMPFRAAKALATTFCWNIRFVLTPMFGLDFPAQCIPPDDPRFNNMIIDPEIIRQAAEDVAYYRSLEPPISRRGSNNSFQKPDRDQQNKTRKSSPCQQKYQSVSPHDIYCVSPTSCSNSTYMLADTPYTADGSTSPRAVFGRGMREEFRSETSSQLTFYGSSLSSNHLSDDDHKRGSQVELHENYYGSDLPSAEVFSATGMVGACSWQPTDTCEPEASLEGSRAAIAAHTLMDLRNSGIRYGML
ncbi:hypothetical protein CBS63078_662 [Aspergillus niger]|uniref:Aldehyde dehydrogenase family protein n=1 Tax=Aspergillus niger TaxID=5061 RepID=A0A254TNV5_ASPNG|nr:hypothetical protein CBS63078_662 [Aspergillus niger]KAI2977127.1 hypothetical protein CBS147323_137 [Aspergillus niger]KAI3023651.1 hypothetical protein CBS147347_6618 [Aspergillus niger]KAI3035430.1 hypothetical protein CBS147345_570 [Aspergillus niger]KAI3088248.1 hypothetical protein CBS147353_155 [Aspergillus niger]